MNKREVCYLMATVPLLMAGVALGQTTEGNVVWSGGAGAGNPYWDVADNWAGGEAPANPTPGQVHYDNIGQDVPGKLDDDYTIGGVRWASNSSTHTLDLDGHTLTLEGQWNQDPGNDHRHTTMYVTNGTLRLGTDENVGSLRVGRSQSETRLYLQQDVVLDTYNASSLTVGGWSGQDKYIDISNAVVSNGVFNVGSVSHTHRGRLLLGDDTLDAIVIRSSLQLQGASPVYIGKTDGILPANVDLTLGTNTDSRASINIAHSERDGQLVARSGGELAAWISTLAVGGGTGTGILDLLAMTTGTVDVVTMRIGTNRSSLEPADAPRGTVRLPVGDHQSGTVEIGGVTQGYGRLELTNSVLTVTNSLTLYPTAEITLHVGSAPSGLDVSGAFVDEGGSIHVNFLAAPTEDIHWAIRVDGDVESTLAGMIGSDRLTWDDSAIDPPFGEEEKSFRAFYDEGTDATYFAITDFVEPQPVAVAQDLTLEALEAEPVLITGADADGGSFDPEDRDFVLTLTYGAQEDVEVLELTGLGVYEDAVLIMTLVDESGDPLLDEEDNPITDTATFTITLEAIADPVETDVIWVGEAGTAAMPRREWFWGKNWADGAPPSTDTPGTIRYDLRGQDVMGRLASDRTIQALSCDGSFTHTLDLDGYRLTVVGQWNQSPGNNIWNTFNVTNGVLQLGTEAIAASINKTGDQRESILRLLDEAVLDTRNIGTITIGGWSSQTRALNMQAATVAGGVFEAGTLRLNRNGRVILGDSTLTDIILRSELRIREGNTKYIGRSSDEKVPPNVNLTLGESTASRAALLMANNGGSGHLATAGGGTFTAWLGTVTIGGSDGNGSFNVTNMTSGTVDALTVGVGIDTATGLLGLPPGEAVIGTLTVGSEQGVGTLVLNQTRTSVTNGATLNATAAVTINVGSELGSGLAIDGGFTLEEGATIHIDFQAEPDHGDIHYGLKLAGDHEAELLAMQAADDLTWDDSALSRDAAIFTRADGYTYVGVLPPPGSLFLLR